MAEEIWTRALDDRGVEWDGGAAIWDDGIVWDIDVEHPEIWIPVSD